MCLAVCAVSPLQCLLPALLVARQSVHPTPTTTPESAPQVAEGSEDHQLSAPHRCGIVWRHLRCLSTTFVLGCDAPICWPPQAQGRDAGCGSASLPEPHGEHMQLRTPYPTCGAGHCRGTLQRSTGAPASWLSLFSLFSVLGPACSCPDQVRASRML
jgi:hypothetical protein